MSEIIIEDAPSSQLDFPPTTTTED